jgi:hypothetical protein
MKWKSTNLSSYGLVCLKLFSWSSFPWLIVVPLSGHEVDGVRKEKERLTAAKKMNEKMSKRRIQIRDLQKQEIEEKEERRLLISKEMQIRNPFAFTVPQIMKIEIK